MKIWILIKPNSYNNAEVEVFTSKEAAKHCQLELTKFGMENNRHNRIQEFEIAVAPATAIAEH
jgi:hypothetical protein